MAGSVAIDVHDRGVLMLPVPRPGVLTEVRGRDAALAVDGVRDVVITAPLGEALVPLPEGHNYLGFVFAEGSVADDVVVSLRRADAALEFDIRPRLGRHG